MADETKPDDPTAVNNTGWMSDVQRAIALILIGSFAIVTLFATLMSIWLEKTSLVDMAKTLQAALVNMSLIALGFFFGNTMAKMAQDQGQQKVMEKLTGPNPPGGPVAPAASEPTVIVAWWSLLTDDEKAAITAAAPTDKRVADFIKAAEVGKAVADDLTYLAGKGLLTEARATQLKDA